MTSSFPVGRPIAVIALGMTTCTRARSLANHESAPLKGPLPSLPRTSDRVLPFVNSAAALILYTLTLMRRAKSPPLAFKHDASLGARTVWALPSSPDAQRLLVAAATPPTQPRPAPLDRREAARALEHKRPRHHAAAWPKRTAVARRAIGAVESISQRVRNEANWPAHDYCRPANGRLGNDLTLEHPGQTGYHLTHAAHKGVLHLIAYTDPLAGLSAIAVVFDVVRQRATHSPGQVGDWEPYSSRPRADVAWASET